MTFPSFSVGEVLTASDMNAVGLWLLETKTVTASAGPIQFDNKFTTNYDTYFLTGHWLQNTSTGIYRFQLQDVSNAAVTGSNYDCTVGGPFYSSGVSQFALAADHIFLGGSVAADYFSFAMWIQRPRDAVKTTGFNQFVADNYNATFANVFVQGGFVHTLATAYYGCRINISAGTVTGKVSLYGYKS
jgi:hypothetical protein